MQVSPGDARDQDSDPVFVLTVVKLVVKAHTQLYALPHVARQVDSFLLSSAWTLERASECGFVRLLDRLLPLEWTGVSDYFREQRLAAAIRRSAYPVDVLQWWVTRYPRDLEPSVGLQSPEVLPFTPRKRLSTYTRTQELVAYTKWAIQHRGVCEVRTVKEALTNAAEYGLFEDLRWLQDHTSEQCSKDALGLALLKGHLSVAKWLYQAYPDQYFNDPWQIACSLEMANWIFKEYKWTSESHRTVCIDSSANGAMAQERSSEDILRFVRFLFSVRPERTLDISVTPARGFPRPLPRYRSKPSTWTMDEAATSGLLDIVRWLHRNDTGGCTVQAMDEAAAHGHLAVVQWLDKHRTEGCTHEAMDQAASNGHLDVVQWLHANRSEGCTTEAMDLAAAHGHLNVVQWLHTNRSEGCTQEAMCEAIRKNDLEMVQWLHANRSEGTTEAGIVGAAWRGYLEMIQWVHANRPEQFIDESIDLAAAHGRLEVVKWLHGRRSTNCTTEPMDQAAAGGHLNVLKFLNTCDQCDWSPLALRRAIEIGHSIVVTWLLDRKHSCPIDQDSVRVAGRRGHLEILKILTSEYINLDWDSNFLSKLQDEGQFAVLEWVLRESLLSEETMIQSGFLKQ